MRLDVIDTDQGNILRYAEMMILQCLDDLPG